MSRRSERPWFCCPDCDEDFVACACPEVHTPRVLGWRDGWDAAMLHVVWTRGRIDRPVVDVEGGELL